MGHSAAVWDYRAATEISKDWNGIDKVVLRNPRGASASVRFQICSFPLSLVAFVEWMKVNYELVLDRTSCNYI